MIHFIIIFQIFYKSVVWLAGNIEMEFSLQQHALRSMEFLVTKLLPIESIFIIIFKIKQKNQWSFVIVL